MRKLETMPLVLLLMVLGLDELRIYDRALIDAEIELLARTLE